MMKRTILLTAMLIGFVGIVVANNIDEAYGFTIFTKNGKVRIIPLADNAVRIRVYNNDAPQLDELIYTENVKFPKWKTDVNPTFTKVKLKGIQVEYNKWTDQLTFFDGKGRKILEEVAYTGRDLRASELADEQYK